MVWQPAEGGTAVSATEWSQGAEGPASGTPEGAEGTGAGAAEGSGGPAGADADGSAGREETAAATATAEADVADQPTGDPVEASVAAQGEEGSA